MRQSIKTSGLLKDDIRELRVGQRWIIGAVLVWPPIMMTTLITLLAGG